MSVIWILCTVVEYRICNVVSFTQPLVDMMNFEYDARIPHAVSLSISTLEYITPKNRFQNIYPRLLNTLFNGITVVGEIFRYYEGEYNKTT